MLKLTSEFDQEFAKHLQNELFSLFPDWEADLDPITTHIAGQVREAVLIPNREERSDALDKVIQNVGVLAAETYNIAFPHFRNAVSAIAASIDAVRVTANTHAAY